MSEPCDKGLPYTRIKTELVEACPRLMMALSKTGNSSHGVHRVETALQACKRIHNIIAEQQETGSSTDKDAIINLACIGELPGYEEKAAYIYEFVKAHSGGTGGQFLTDLDSYERFLPVKRKLNAADLAKLATVSLPAGPSWIPMMVKAMLNAPGTMVSNGFADVFSPSDISSIGANGKNHINAISGAKQALAAKEFLQAYSQLDATTIDKLTSDLEVRTVTHVHGKTTQSRKTFTSLLHIAATFYTEASQLDKALPKWPMLAQYAETSHLTSAASDSGIRELRTDGTIPNAELFRLGFTFLAKLLTKKDKGELAPDMYKISSMSDPKDVHLEKIATEDLEKTSLIISRVSLVTEWCVHTASVQEALP